MVLLDVAGIGTLKYYVNIFDYVKKYTISYLYIRDLCDTRDISLSFFIEVVVLVVIEYLPLVLGTKVTGLTGTFLKLFKTFLNIFCFICVTILLHFCYRVNNGRIGVLPDEVQFVRSRWERSYRQERTHDRPQRDGHKGLQKGGQGE